MDNEGLSAIGRGVDLSKVPSIPQKRTATFMNHYLTRSAQLLNEVCAVAESQLERALEQLQQLEAGICILEGKLNSIPGLTNGITLEQEPRAATPQSVVTAQPLSLVDHVSPVEVVSSGSDLQAGSAQIAGTENQASHENTQLHANEDGPLVREDERFQKYFKMLSVGIATAAVQHKMQMDGLNPDLLLTPNAIAPPPH